MTNQELIAYVSSHWIFILLCLSSIIKFIPAEWVGLSRTVGTTDPQRHLVSIFYVIVGGFFEVFARSCMNLSIAFGLGNVVTFLIFVVVIFDITVAKQISVQAVTLIGIGIVALYLDRLVETGKEISFFGICKWTRKDSTD